METELRDIEKGIMESVGALAAARGRLNGLIEVGGKDLCELDNVSCVLALVVDRLEKVEGQVGALRYIGLSDREDARPARTVVRRKRQRLD